MSHTTHDLPGVVFVDGPNRRISLTVGHRNVSMHERRRVDPVRRDPGVLDPEDVGAEWSAHNTTAKIHTRHVVEGATFVASKWVPPVGAACPVEWVDPLLIVAVTHPSGATTVRLPGNPGHIDRRVDADGWPVTLRGYPDIHVDQAAAKLDGSDNAPGHTTRLRITARALDRLDEGEDIVVIQREDTLSLDETGTPPEIIDAEVAFARRLKRSKTEKAKPDA